MNGELRVHGFSTRQESASGGASLRIAQDLLKRTGADACLFLAWQGQTSVIEVWIAAPPSPPVLFEAVALRRSPDVPMKLAVRAVDLLKAALTRDRGAAASAPTPPAPAATVSASPVFAPGLSRWSIELGGSFLTDWRAFGGAWGPQVLVARSLSQRLALAVRVAGPSFGAGYSTANAGVDLVQSFGLVEVLAIIARKGGFALRAAAGAGGYYLRATGTVPERFVTIRPRQDGGWALAGAVGMDAVFPMAERLSLVASARGLLVVPAPRVVISGEEQQVGRPLAALALNARWTF